MKKITIGLADDHQLVLRSLSLLIDSFGGFTVTVEAHDGKMLIDKLALMKELPDIVLLDVNMPVMDGVATSAYICTHYPTIKVVALTMKDDDATIIEMLKTGICAYLLKDINPAELERALNEIAEKGYYNGDATNILHRRKMALKKDEVVLSAREKEFLQLACTDHTYESIAGQMGVSAKTVDGYRASLFQKLNVQSRTGMALEGIRKKLVEL